MVDFSELTPENINMFAMKHYDIECVGVSSTVWRITGFVASDTAPAFAD